MSRCIAFAFLVLFVGIAVAEEAATDLERGSCPAGSKNCRPEDDSIVLSDDNIMLQKTASRHRVATQDEDPNDPERDTEEDPNDPEKDGSAPAMSAEKAALLQEKRAKAAAEEKDEEGEEDEEHEWAEDEDEDEDEPEDNTALDTKKFKQLDTNGDGAVSKKEFKAGVIAAAGALNANVAIVFQNADTDKSSSLSLEEFLAVEAKRPKSLLQESEESRSNRRRRRWWGTWWR